jgi:hypothetical protein
MPPSVRPAYAAPKNESSKATARQKKSRHRSANAGPTRSNSARRKSNLGNFYGDVGGRGGRGRGIVGRAPPDAPSSTCGRGTEGSNPASSSGESGANRNWPAGTSLSSSGAFPDSITSFGVIQAASAAGNAAELVFFIFELHLDGDDIGTRLLIEHKALLVALLSGVAPPLHCSDYQRCQGTNHR